MKAMGLGTLFIGAAGGHGGGLSVQGGKLASLDTAATLSMILALALGTLVGSSSTSTGRWAPGHLAEGQGRPSSMPWMMFSATAQAMAGWA